MENIFEYHFPRRRISVWKFLITKKMSNEELREILLKQNKFLRGKNSKIKVVIMKKIITRLMANWECHTITHGKILQERSLCRLAPACRVFDYVHITSMEVMVMLQKNVKVKTLVLSMVHQNTLNKISILLNLNLDTVRARIIILCSIIIVIRIIKCTVHKKV